MLVKHLLQEFKNTPEWAGTNVDSIRFDGYDYYFDTDFDRIEDLENQLEDAREDAKKLNEQLQDESKRGDDLEKEIDELRDTLRNFELSPGESVADLVERNEWQGKKIAELQESLNKFNRRYEEDQWDIKDLRARKNKTTVKRCLTTGRLIANFGGVDYELTKKN